MIPVHTLGIILFNILTIPKNEKNMPNVWKQFITINIMMVCKLLRRQKRAWNGIPNQFCPEAIFCFIGGLPAAKKGLLDNRLFIVQLLLLCFPDELSKLLLSRVVQVIEFLGILTYLNKIQFFMRKTLETTSNLTIRFACLKECPKYKMVF